MKAIDRQRRSWSDVWWVYGRSGERFSSGESRFFRSCGQRTSGFLFGSSLDSPCGNVVQPDHERSGLSQGLRAALVTACYQQSDAKCPRVRHCRRWRASRRTAQPDTPAGPSPSHVSHRKGRAARTGEAGGGLGAQGHIVRGPRDRGCREAQRLQQHAPASAHGLGQGLRGHLYLRRLPARLLWPRVSGAVHIPVLRKALADKLGTSGAPGMTRLRKRCQSPGSACAAIRCLPKGD